MIKANGIHSVILLGIVAERLSRSSLDHTIDGSWNSIIAAPKGGRDVDDDMSNLRAANLVSSEAHALGGSLRTGDGVRDWASYALTYLTSAHEHFTSVEDMLDPEGEY